MSSVSIPFKRERHSELRTGNPQNLFFFKVSIPFKRERHSELDEANNKATAAENVSIPFKRERHSEQIDLAPWVLGRSVGFHSLQTGKTF